MSEVNILRKIEELRELTQKMITAGAQSCRPGDFVTVTKGDFKVLGEFTPIEEEVDEIDVIDTTHLVKDEIVLIMNWDEDNEVWRAWVVNTYLVIKVKPKQIIERVVEDV